MSLVDEAIEFIYAGGVEALSALLLKCVNAGSLDGLSAVQRLYEDMYDDFTFNSEFKTPAALALLAWEIRGLEALVEGAIRTDTPKNISIVTQLLSSLGADDIPEMLMSSVRDEVLRNKIRNSIQRFAARQVIARQMLAEYMLTFSDDDSAASAAGSAMTMLSFQGGQAAKELFRALAGRWLAVGRPLIERYETLLTENKYNEPTFQSFFESVPQLLDPLTMQVWPTPNLHGSKVPDFVLRRADGTYLVVEIETPGKTLITNALHVTAEVTHAVAQATDYRTFLMERYAEANAHFPGFCFPDCLVVIGLAGC